VRFLAIDLGDKRTGLAVGDDDIGIVSPLRVLERAGDALLDEIARAAREHAADALVVGLPLNMDGTEGPRAKGVRDLARRIGDRTGLPIFVHDERLSSAAADWDLAGTGLTRAGKKQRRDALAAAAILRDFLASRGGEGAGGYQ
jgi:putative Holliday junction resolvase